MSVGWGGVGVRGPEGLLDQAWEGEAGEQESGCQGRGQAGG